MFDIHHPSRYLDGLRAVLDRVDVITKLEEPAREALLQAEFVGLSDEQIATFKARLKAIQGYIADWRQDGQTTFDVEFVLAELADAKVATPILTAETFDSGTVYLHFGQSARLALGRRDGAYVDGAYLSPSYRDGKPGIDLAFVCGGQAWNKFSSLGCGRAMSVAAEVAIGFIPFSACPLADIPISWLDVAPTLSNEEVLKQARLAAEKVISILQAKNTPSSRAATRRSANIFLQ